MVRVGNFFCWIWICFLEERFFCHENHCLISGPMISPHSAGQETTESYCRDELPATTYLYLQAASDLQIGNLCKIL